MKTRLTLCVLLFTTLVNAQTSYPSILSNPGVTNVNSNFVIAQGQVENYLNATPPANQLMGTKSFGRWNYFWNSRNSSLNSQPGGSLLTLDYFGEMMFNNTVPVCNESAQNSKWTLIGPKKSPVSDMGVAFCVAMHPTNTNVIYAGTQASGLWKTTNANDLINGPNWVCITDNIKFPSLGVSSIIINPNNQNHIIFSSGAHIHGEKTSYGAGIFESMDAGTTWNRILAPPSNALNTLSDYFISKVVFKPNDPNTLYAVSLDKVYTMTRSNSGDWTYSASNTNFFAGLSNSSVGSRANYLMDIELMVNNGVTRLFVSSFVKAPIKINPNTGAKIAGVHAVIWTSIDEGISWTPVNLPLRNLETDDDCSFISLDVSNASPGVLYAQQALWDYPKSSFLYRSEDNGATWTFITGVNNDVASLFGNHVLHVSDFNDDIIFLGEDLLYKVNDALPGGGQPYKETVTEYGPSAYATHADIRDIVEINTNGLHRLIIAHDGGVSICEQSAANSALWGKNNWKNVNGNGLAISQFSGFDFFPSTGFVVGGKQDNATQRQINTNDWQQIGGCDGNMIRMNKFDESIFIGGCNQDAIFKFKGPPVNGNFDNYTWHLMPDRKYFQFAPIKVDPVDQTQFWVAQENLYRFNSDGLGSFTPQVKTAIQHISAFAINPSNNNILYMAAINPTWNTTGSNVFFKSIDRGATWLDKSADLYADLEGLPTFLYGSTSASDIVIDPNRTNRIFMSMNQFAASSTNSQEGVFRVVYSPDGGDTWFDMSAGLTPFPVNRLVYQEGTDDVIYAATDVGVYRWNKGLQRWECFNKDLPLAIVNDLQIDYCRNKLLCSTWGRGIWEAPIPVVDEPYIIAENTTWETKSFHSFATNVIVPYGVTLTIKGHVSFAAGKYLIVQKGGKVNVLGGKLFNVCGNRWGGVLVEGKKTSDQLPTNNQGHIYCLNATITNAENGISTVGIDANGNIDWSKTGGGIIQANNTRFTNNGRHLQLMSYQRPGAKNDISTFIGCTFEVTGSAYVGNTGNNRNGIMVTAWGVKGVRFSGCTFKNLEGSVNADRENTDRGTGILSYDAALIIDDVFNDVACTTVRRGNFYDLSTGVKSYFSASLPFSGEVKKQDFALTDRGIWLENAGNINVHHNNFNLFVPAAYYNRAYSNSLSDITRKTGIAGIYSKGSAGYRIEQNNFNMETTPGVAAPRTASQLLVGVVLDNAETNGGAGMYRLNTMQNLNAGSQTQQNNTSLQMSCNQYQNTDFGLRLNPERLGTTPSFGECAPANDPIGQQKRTDYGNTFVTNSPFDAQHKPLEPNTQANIKTYVVQSGQANRPTTSTVNVNINVNNCINEGTVLPKDPNCPPLPQLQDICYATAWPKPGTSATQHNLNKQGLANTEGAIAAGTLSGNEAESQLGFYQREVKQSRAQLLWANNLLALYDDESKNYVEQAINFLETEDDVASKKMLVAAYYYVHNYTAAINLLGNLPNAGDDEMNTFVAFYQTIVLAAMDDRGIYQLTESEWETITDISTYNTSAANAAKGLLELVQGQYFHPYIEKGIEGMLNKKANTGIMEAYTQHKQGLWVYPNPANQNLQVLFKVTELNSQNTITLTDVVGKVIETKAYNHLSGSVSFNTNTLANGTYFVNLVSNGKLLSTQKIIIQH